MCLRTRIKKTNLPDSSRLPPEAGDVVIFRIICVSDYREDLTLLLFVFSDDDLGSSCS